jgi:hypothetical protein
MKTISRTPTSAKDYAALSATYASGLVALAIHQRRRRDGGDSPPLSDLAWTAAATFALAQALVHEKVETWVRQPFVEEVGDDQQDAQHIPRGEGMRYAVGELLSCTRCTGAWASLALNGLQIVAPSTGRVVTRVLAGAAANDFLEIAFTWARQEANLISESQARLDRQAPASA